MSADSWVEYLNQQADSKAELPEDMDTPSQTIGAAAKREAAFQAEKARRKGCP